MIDLPQRALIAGVLFLPTIATGFWLTQKGGPPPVGLTTVHKLSALANLIVLNKTFFDVRKAGLVTDSDWISMGVMNLCFAGTIATGAMLTMEKDFPQSITTAHHLTPWLTAAASGLLLLLLGR